MKFKNNIALMLFICLLAACNERESFIEENTPDQSALGGEEAQGESSTSERQNTPGQLSFSGEAIQGESIVVSIADEDGVDTPTLQIMNNFGIRASDHTSEPSYSPIVLEYFDPSDNSVTKIVWGQSENPNYVYDSPQGCDVCFSDQFRPSVLFTQKI